MTKEEAILVLDNARPQTKEIDRQFYDDEDLNNALDIAIKALEQQPSDDCISRQAVLDEAYAYGYGLEPEGYCVDVKDIQALPPVTPTQRWIPVSERLPEKQGDYLCSLYYAVPPYNVFHPEKDIYIHDVSVKKFDGKSFISSVKAWQPLPKPYEEKRGDSDGSIHA